MKIRPRNIMLFQNGGGFDLQKWINDNPEYFKWYSGIYPNAQKLMGDPLKQRNNYWNKNQLSSSHYTTDDLRRSAYNNYLYTNDYNARLEDISKWAEAQKDLNNLTSQQIVDRYNKLAGTIRQARETPLTYNTGGYSDTNRTFRTMFYNRSRLGTNTPLYTIGYLDNLDDIEGTSTWQRRMDRYQSTFENDTEEGKKNRIFYITKPNGEKIKVYKKENGDIGLFPNDPIDGGELPEVVVTPNKDPEKPGGSVEEQHNKYGGFDWNKISEGLKRMYPGLLGAGRLAGTLISNNRIYNEALKGIRPNLMLSYHTHRQVVGDEATKLAYYRRATQGLTRAAQPFTADADRLIAYQNEAKRIGDELRAQGDLADNAEIRRTSDESNQHQWANKLRDTEVANANTASINQANALRQNLLAQKHASDWSSINNYLLEKETRARQAYAEEQAIQDQLWLLLELQKLANDDTYADLYKKAAKDVNDGLTTSENIRAFNNYKTQLEINRLKNRPRRNSGFFLFAKKGTALEYKKKDDLLYKTARDVVEHFRKMSKYSSDSYNRRPIKIEKLAPHPKGNTRRYLLGGMAPFVVYTPAPIGGETTMSSQASTSGSGSGKGSGKDESLELVKSLFKEIGGNGLPIDVNLVYNNMQKLFNLSKILGTEMTSSDIASIYLLAMQLLSNIKYSLDSFNKLEQLAANNDALNEFAVTADGLYVVSDKNGIISYEKSLEKIIKEGKNPITNQQLLNMRAYSPHLAFSKGDYIIDNVIANGMGINKIGTQIKALAGNLGSTEGKLEGISQVESGKVRAGLQILSGTQGTPDGYYSVTNTGKDLKKLIEAAINYISSMLSPSQKAILQAHGGVELSIISFLTSQENYTREQSISPLTGKASNKDNSKESSEGLKLDAATALVTGKGYKSEIELNPGSNYAIKALGRFTEFQKKSGENMGAGTTMLEATESTIKGNLDWNKATIGGSRIISTAYNQVILNNGEVAGIDLPVDPNNPDAPNFEMLKQLENLDKLLKLNNIEDSELNWKKVNEICDKIGIPHKYDSTGKLNLNLWKRFAAFLVTTPDTALVNKNVILDMVGVASKEERDLYNNFILNKTNNKNFELSDTFLGFGHRDELYKGTVFVPVKESIVASAISGGLNIYMNLATDLELREQGYDSSKVKSYKKSEYSL